MISSVSLIAAIPEAALVPKIHIQLEKNIPVELGEYFCTKLSGGKIFSSSEVQLFCEREQFTKASELTCTTKIQFLFCITFVPWSLQRKAQSDVDVVFWKQENNQRKPKGSISVRNVNVYNSKQQLEVDHMKFAIIFD